MKIKNLFTICCVVFLSFLIGSACRNNPLAKYSKQYHCIIEGEPEPQTSEEYLKRAEKHLAGKTNSGAFDECAFNAASEAVRLDPKNADAFAFRGFLYKARASVYLEKADARAWRESLELALEDLNDAIRLAPDQAKYYDIRSSIYESGGFLDETNAKILEDYTKAIELSPPGKSLADLYARRGDYFLFDKKYEKAVKDFAEAIKLDPENTNFYSKRAEAYQGLGKNDLAEADRTKAAELKAIGEVSSPNAPPQSETPENSGSSSKPLSAGVLNRKATYLPKPAYPSAAKAVKASGAVIVRVTVDETGSVVSVSPVSGHPLLRASAVETARQARFSPTILSGKPVKVTGLIVYNFAPE